MNRGLLVCVYGEGLEARENLQRLFTHLRGHYISNIREIAYPVAGSFKPSKEELEHFFIDSKDARKQYATMELAHRKEVQKQIFFLMHKGNVVFVWDYDGKELLKSLTREVRSEFEKKFKEQIFPAEMCISAEQIYTQQKLQEIHANITKTLQGQ